MNSDADLRASQRDRLREQRLVITPVSRISAAQALAAHVCAALVDRAPGDIAGYWATGGELSLHAVLHALPDGWRYCLPLLYDERRLRFARWSPGDAIEPNRFGIPEPVVSAGQALLPDQLQIALVPLVGFDRSGNRLGMGGGWYDRSFAFRQSRPVPPLLIGVGYANQEIDRIDVQAWDVAMDFVATESELIDCRQQRMT